MRSGLSHFSRSPGAPAATRLGFQAVRRQGTYARIALHEEPFPFDFLDLLVGEVQFMPTFGTALNTWDRALWLTARGKVDLEAQVSDVLPLDAWEAGLRKIEARQGLKMLRRP